MVIHDFGDCRAYPDEKGIETHKPRYAESSQKRQLQSLSRWKGNWNNATITPSAAIRIPDCRAYPDEKGIETV